MQLPNNVCNMGSNTTEYLQHTHAHTRTHARTHAHAHTHTHTHTHCRLTNRSERQCCLTEIYGGEKCLLLVFEGQSHRVPYVLSCGSLFKMWRPQKSHNDSVGVVTSQSVYSSINHITCECGN